MANPVETPAGAQPTRTRGCDDAQGRLLASPGQRGPHSLSSLTHDQLVSKGKDAAWDTVLALLDPSPSTAHCPEAWSAVAMGPVEGSGASAQ